MNREQLRQRISALERLEDILAAIGDMHDCDFKDGEKVSLALAGHGADKAAIAHINFLPPEIVLIGLRAMQQAMEKITAQEALPA